MGGALEGEQLNFFEDMSSTFVERVCKKITTSYRDAEISGKNLAILYEDSIIRVLKHELENGIIYAYDPDGVLPDNMAGQTIILTYYWTASIPGEP